MPFYKVQFMQNISGDCAGYSHQYYFQANDHTELRNPATQIQENLRAMTSHQVSYKGWRISQEGVRGDVYTRRTEGLKGLVSTELGNPTNCMQVKYFLGNGYVVDYFYKGIAKNMVLAREDGTFTYDNTAQGLHVDLVNELISQKALLRVLERPQENEYRTIEAVAFDEATNQYELTVNNAGLLVGSRIFIDGLTVRNWPNLRGEQIIASLTTDGITVRSRVACDQTLYQGGLRLHVRAYTYRNFQGPDFWDVVGLTSKKNGRPFFVHRGRSSNRRAKCLILPAGS